MTPLAEQPFIKPNGTAMKLWRLIEPCWIHLREQLSQFVWISLDDKFFPAIEPAIPELHTHERLLFAMLRQRIPASGQNCNLPWSRNFRHKDIVINQRTSLKR